MYVKEWRLYRGWTQQQLAELSGLSVRTIARIEQGQSASLESINALLAVFELSREEFEIAPPTFRSPDIAEQDRRKITQASEFMRRVINRSVLIVLLFLVNALTNAVSTTHYWWAGYATAIIMTLMLWRAIRIFVLKETT
ncbi:helix-turn-helix domain-containing protein [Celerinatantimonas yamalensis]|uniref:Helix-turn-helix transcriptional regulator n=1 Tax=Celerinatantimonas yamalensis TaxID=559956 RepID=A0ABW9G1Z7_9GAMM